MPADIAGLPHWEMTFDADGHPDPAQHDALVAEVPAGGITDLVVFSHGWNNDLTTARNLYTAFFSLLPPLLPAAGTAGAPVVGTVGVFWPSMRWSDEPIPAFPVPATGGGGGAASMTSTPTTPAGGLSATDQATVAALKDSYTSRTAHDAIDRLFALLSTRPDDQSALEEFHTLMAALAPNPAPAHAAHGGPEDHGESGMLDAKPADLFARFAEAVAVVDPAGTMSGNASGGGAAGLGSALGSLWNGAKEALRQVTYWQMKSRAGTVGQQGLARVVADIAAAAPQVRVHLVGHSFGGRLVSFVLAGLPDTLTPSPVKSLTLIEGAYSHWAFASSLPEPLSGSGGLLGKQTKVDGPLVVCFSSHDSALGVFYPMASMSAFDNAAGLMADAMYPWGAMGHDGAQGVDAAAIAVQNVRGTYSFAHQAFTNVDTSRVVCNGGAPSGSHSDIVHPELAWVVLAAGGITGG